MNPVLTFLLRLILLLLAYGFVGWVAYSLFGELRKSTSHKGQQVVLPISLTIELDDQSILKQFQSPELIIGRDPASDFEIKDSTISLHHCKLAFHHKQWWAEDLGSTNGSYLNNTPIQSPMVVTNGDELRLGQVSLTININ